MDTVVLWLGSVTTIISGWKVITSKNPILSVFWLVLAFANAAVLLLLVGVEFLPLLFVIVYVGAIAILFLFVVMLLNIKLVEIAENTTRYVPIGILTGLVFLYSIYFGLDFFKESETLDLNWTISNYSNIIPEINIIQFGELLYTEYWVLFLTSSLVLLVSMLGAIVLCLYHEEGVKRQDLFSQIATEYSQTVKNVK